MNPSDTAASGQPVFDADVLGAMFGNDSVVIASVLETFEVSTRDTLAELFLVAATQDMASVAALTHKIAGACRMSGAQALGHTARSTEEAAKRGDFASVQQGLVNLQTQWPLVQAAIANLRHTQRQ